MRQRAAIPVSLLLLLCCQLSGCAQSFFHSAGESHPDRCQLSGCTQSCFQSEGESHRNRNLPVYLPDRQPFAPDHDTAPPPPEVATILRPDGKRRPISLPECIALALENGRVGGIPIRALAYDPAIAGTDIERSLSKFDVEWRTSMTWNTIDEPVGTALQRLSTTEDVIKDQAATFLTQLLKPLPTGGFAGVQFRTDYDFTNTIQTLNPLYRPRLTFTFEQPLLQGSGVDINQLLPSHPDAVIQNLPTSGNGAPGILLARISFDQSRDRFVASVQEMIFQVEAAYWNLYFSYWGLYARDATLQQAVQTYSLAKKYYDAGKLRIQDLAQIEQQYQILRVARLRALGDTGAPSATATVTAPGNVGQVGVLEAERVLRYVVGLPPEDGCKLMPTDTPTKAGFQPDWHEAVNTALAQRPELIESRRALRATELLLTRAKNLALPDLRFFSSYDFNGIGSHLDGGDDPFNALHSLASNRFHDWTVGLRMDVPIGYRDANAQIRAAHLQLQRQMALLRDQEKQAVFALQKSYQQLLVAYEQIGLLTARRKASEVQYQALLKEFQSGETNEVYILLQSQRNWDDALVQERIGIFDYNIALADFYRQSGTILDYDGVKISEGPLPSCAQDRASAHIRERTNAKLLRERPLTNQVSAAGKNKPGDKAAPVLPPPGEPAPIAQMLEADRKVESPDTLPPPTPLGQKPENQPAEPINDSANQVGEWRPSMPVSALDQPAQPINNSANPVNPVHPGDEWRPSTAIYPQPGGG